MKTGRLLRGWLLAVVLTAGCEELGNPPRGGAVTEWAKWSNGRDVTQTRARSVPAGEWRELLRHLPDGRLEHPVREPARGEVAALVTVRARWGRPSPPRVVELLTRIELTNGQVFQRAWHVRGGTEQWYALFTLPAPPRKAITRIR